MHLNNAAFSMMQAGGATTQAVQGVSQASTPPLLVKWLCLCLGRLVEDQPELLSLVGTKVLYPSTSPTCLHEHSTQQVMW